MEKNNRQIQCGRIWCLYGMILIMVSCGGQGKPASFDGNFPYEKVPAFITDPGEAARYMAKNYWKLYLDAGVRDTSAFAIADGKLEEAYAGYIQILSLLKNSSGPDSPGAEKTAQLIAASQSKLFAAADSLYLAGHKKFLVRLLEMSEKYLYNPNSPYLDEEMYIPVLEAVLRLNSLDSLHKITYMYQRQLAGLNRVGSPANDFEYVYKSDGLKKHGPWNGPALKHSSLYRTEAEFLLIYFNNPDCASCREMKGRLMADPVVGALLKSGRLRVLSMYIDEDVSLWDKEYAEFPKEWIYARDEKLVLRNNDLYGIRAIPSMYLLDKEKTVILKDALPQRVIEHLGKMVHP